MPLISHIPLHHLVAQRDIHSSSSNQLYCGPLPSNQNLLHHLACRTLEAWHLETSVQIAQNCSSLAMIQILRWQLMDKMFQLYLYIHFLISENKIKRINEINFQEWVHRNAYFYTSLIYSYHHFDEQIAQYHNITA